MLHSVDPIKHLKNDMLHSVYPMEHVVDPMLHMDYRMFHEVYHTTPIVFRIKGRVDL